MANDLFDLIEKRRTELEMSLAAAIEKRDAANEAVKSIRAQLDDLPVRKVRRAKKSAGAKLADKVVNGEISEDFT